MLAAGGRGHRAQRRPLPSFKDSSQRYRHGACGPCESISLYAEEIGRKCRLVTHVFLHSPVSRRVRRPRHFRSGPGCANKIAGSPSAVTASTLERRRTYGSAPWQTNSYAPSSANCGGPLDGTLGGRTLDRRPSCWRTSSSLPAATRHRSRRSSRSARVDGPRSLPAHPSPQPRRRGRLPGYLPGPGTQGGFHRQGRSGRQLVVQGRDPGAALPSPQQQGALRTALGGSDGLLAGPGNRRRGALWRDSCRFSTRRSRLPEKYVKCSFVLCYLQGHTNEEAAEQLGVPEREPSCPGWPAAGSGCERG